MAGFYENAGDPGNQFGDSAKQSATESKNWATYPEDQLVPSGNLVDDYSARHHARKAEQSGTAASGSAASAAAAEIAANASATAAASSATTASTAADTSSTKATEASASALAASVSEGNAAASETAAGLSEAAASASEVNANSSALNAATSASNAATSASNASSSAASALTSANNASNSENAAEGFANDAALSAADAVREPLTAHGLMREPSLSDFSCPAVVPNQFVVLAREERIGGKIVSIPNTNVTLPAAPATSSLLSRRDVVYLRESGIIGVFEGLDDNSDMATAGFSAVSGEDGLWSDGTGLATPLVYVHRRNQGAYHPFFNENGCAYSANGSDVTGRSFWESVNSIISSTAECFTLASTPANANGSLTTTAVGSRFPRPDGLFYDAIYLSDITIPSLQATAPSPTQLEPDYWRDKLAANTFKGFHNEGIPFLVPIERGVVETQTTATTSGKCSVGDESLYSDSDFVIVLNQDNVPVYSGYSVIEPVANTIRLYTTLTNGYRDSRQTWDRTNGDIYTILKVEYREAKTSDLTWTDIIGDPVNYPRQATGVIDWESNQGTQTITAGQAIECSPGHTAGGVVGNIYLRVATGGSVDLSTAVFTNTILYRDLGPKATFLANAQGMAGFPLIYGENGEDLIPDGTSKEYKVRRKCASVAGVQVSDDKGVSWIENSAGWGALTLAPNSRTSAEPLGRFEFITYRTSALPLEVDELTPVLASKFGDVKASSHSAANNGSVFISSLIGKVPTKGSGVRQGVKPLDSYSLTSEGLPTSGSSHEPTSHGAFNLEAGDSPAAKALPYLTQDKQPKLQVLFKEMIYDAGADDWIDGGSQTAIATTTNYLQGVIYKVIEPNSGLEGYYVLCVQDRPSTFGWGVVALNSQGVIQDGAGVTYEDTFVVWNGSGWGDNNKFTVASNTDTDTDDNANTILVGTKSIPLPFILKD